MLVSSRLLLAQVPANPAPADPRAVVLPVLELH